MSLKTVYESLKTAAKYLTGSEKPYSEIYKTWSLLQRMETSMLRDAGDRKLGRLAHVMKDSASDNVFATNAKAGYFNSLLSAVSLKNLDEKYDFGKMTEKLERKPDSEYVEKAKELLLKMKPIGIFEQRLKNSAL